jgi:transcriptional regulator with XRE-family HTH domain
MSSVVPSWLWDSESLRRALASLEFGAALKTIRRATGLNQLQFANVLGWEQSEVSRAESGRRSILYDIRRLLEVCDALDMPRTALTPVIMGAHHDVPSRVQEEGTDMNMNRRELGASVLGLAASAGLSYLHVPEKVDSAHVRYFSAAVDQLYSQDQRVGGGALAEGGLRLYYRVRRILDESDYAEATARPLMSVAGELAACVSWLCYDAGDYRTARALHSNAHMLAEQAGDTRLAIRVMQGMVLQLVEAAREDQHPGYARQAVILSKRAAELARSEPSPQLHALLAAREALAQAAVGNSTEFDRALSRARREMDREPARDVPAWLKFVNPSEIASHEVRGRWYLGDPKGAADLYQAILQARPLSPRTEVAARANLARIVASAGDFVGAFAEGSVALSVLEEGKIRSTRAMRRLQTIRQLAATRASGAEFREHYDRVVGVVGPT